MDSGFFGSNQFTRAFEVLRETGWSDKRCSAMHFLLSGWDLQSLAALMGRSLYAIEADWQQFLTHAEAQPCEPCQLDLFPMTEVEYAAVNYDHYSAVPGAA